MTKFVFLAVLTSILAVGLSTEAAPVDQTSAAGIHQSSHKVGQMAKHHKKHHKKHHQAA